MKAAVYRAYGAPEVVHVEEVDTPEPQDDEIRIRVRASTISAADWRIRSQVVPRGFGLIMRLVFGVKKPRQPILGLELAGDIDKVGGNVEAWQVGQRVFAFPGAKMGAHAQYRCLPADAPIVAIPDGLGYKEAAALSFGGTTALTFLRRAQVEAGQKILVNGASGCVGSALVQLAVHQGAEVTGVTSTKNLALVRELGATNVIDYTKSDLLQEAETYDVIADPVGNLPYQKIKHLLTKDGRLLAITADLPQMLRIPLVHLRSKHRIIAGPAAEDRDDLEHLARLAEQGHYRPVIDKVYPLEAIVEAHRHVDTGHKKGSVVISMPDTAA